MNPIHATLPAERFYWGLLEVQGLPRVHRRDPKALGYLFESVLPIPIEQVQATFAKAADGTERIIACGMHKDHLAVLATEHPAALTLTPESLPAFINSAVVPPHELNLFTGVYEPHAIRRTKRRLLSNAAAFIALFAALITFGLHRRAVAVREHIAEAQDARQQIILATMGHATSSSQPPELRMLAELRSLQQTRGRTLPATDIDDEGASDVLTSFAHLVRDWPRDLRIRTESVSITPTSMTVRGLAPSSSDVQTFADALSGLPGWRLQQPQISATGTDAVNATWQWKRHLAPSMPPQTSLEGTP